MNNIIDIEEVINKLKIKIIGSGWEDILYPFMNYKYAYRQP